jgi:hypothetical protein
MLGFRNRPRRVRSPRPARVAIETLEDRRVPAVFNPLASASDGAPNSLRAAIIAANGNGQDNVINLQAGVYQLTIANTAGHENNAAQGDLNLTAVNHTTTIQGQGAGVTIIDGGGLDRVFEVNSGVTAVLRGLTIQHGLAQEAGDPGTLPDVEPGFGGGLLNLGTTTLDNVDVENNVAQGGAGRNGTFNPTVGITPATGGLSGLGGGIYNSGVLTLTQSIIRDNAAAGGSGGTGYPNGDVASAGGGGGALGGGIFNTGPLTISQSLIATNHADGGHGGDAGDNYGDQSPGNNGGNGGDAFGGGIYIADVSAAVTVMNSAIAENDGQGGAGGQGG